MVLSLVRHQKVPQHPTMVGRGDGRRRPASRRRPLPPPPLRGSTAPTSGTLSPGSGKATTSDPPPHRAKQEPRRNRFRSRSRALRARSNDFQATCARLVWLLLVVKTVDHNLLLPRFKPNRIFLSKTPARKLADFWALVRGGGNVGVFFWLKNESSSEQFFDKRKHFNFISPLKNEATTTHVYFFNVTFVCDTWDPQNKWVI